MKSYKAIVLKHCCILLTALKKEEKQMANKPVYKCTLLLMQKEMQIKS